MTNKLLLILFLTVFSNSLYSQTFVDRFTSFIEEKPKNDDTYKKGTNKERKVFFTRQYQQLNHAFDYYKSKTGVVLNMADSICLLIQTKGRDSISDICVWNNSDTLLYTEQPGEGNNKKERKMNICASFPCNTIQKSISKTISLEQLMRLIL